jgi:hypothetical protein
MEYDKLIDLFYNVSALFNDDLELLSNILYIRFKKNGRIISRFEVYNDLLNLNLKRYKNYLDFLLNLDDVELKKLKSLNYKLSIKETIAFLEVVNEYDLYSNLNNGTEKGRLIKDLEKLIKLSEEIIDKIKKSR